MECSGESSYPDDLVLQRPSPTALGLAVEELVVTQTRRADRVDELEQAEQQEWDPDEDEGCERTLDDVLDGGRHTHLSRIVGPASVAAPDAEQLPDGCSPQAGGVEVEPPLDSLLQETADPVQYNDVVSPQDASVTPLDLDIGVACPLKAELGLPQRDHAAGTRGGRRDMASADGRTVAPST